MEFMDQYDDFNSNNAAVYSNNDKKGNHPINSKSAVHQQVPVRTTMPPGSRLVMGGEGRR